MTIAFAVFEVLPMSDYEVTSRSVCVYVCVCVFSLDVTCAEHFAAVLQGQFLGIQ